MKNNPVGAVRQYCSDVSKSIKEQDWNTVSYKLGQGFFNTAAVVLGAKVTKGTVPGKVSSGSGIGSSVRNSLNSMFDGTPALAGTNGMVIAGAAVPAEASIASSAVSGAAGVGVGVNAVAAVGSGIYYSSNGSNQSSGGGASQSGLSVKQYPDGSIRDSRGRFAGKTGTIPGAPGVDKAKEIIKTDSLYNGYTILGEEISVRCKSGKLRRYDIVARKPDGNIVGIEVKSGTARRTAQQKMIDNELLNNGGLRTVGDKAKKLKIDQIHSMELIKVK